MSAKYTCKLDEIQVIVIRFKVRDVLICSVNCTVSKSLVPVLYFLSRYNLCFKGEVRTV